MSPHRSGALPLGTTPSSAPAVCRAGEFQFAPGQALVNGRVQSRAIFWCKSGHGEFRVNGQPFVLEPHDLYVLPWNRRIEYHASRTDPMYTAHVHVVPWIRPGSRWEANVPHERGEPLADSPDRADLPWPGFDGVMRFRIPTEGSTARLVGYTTAWFRDSGRAEEEARALGLLWWRELERLGNQAVPNEQRYPEELKRLLLYVERNFQLAPTVEDLAGILGRSRSHVLKLFQSHLGTSAKSHILQRQLRESRDLLLSTTLPIGEVGRRSGFQDPYHFSKLFRRLVGTSPKDFRAASGTFPMSRIPTSHRQSPPVAGQR